MTMVTVKDQHHDVSSGPTIPVLPTSLTAWQYQENEHESEDELW